MFSRRFSFFAVAGATLAGSLAFASPAVASVTYDPETKTGFVDRADVQKAFGWSGAELAAHAAGVVFQHDFWTDDTYSVGCGDHVVNVVHHKDFGRFELTDTVVDRAERGAASDYGRKPAGFRITGAHAGISGTSVAPAVGQPCPVPPETGDKQPVIDRVHLENSTTGWALTISSDQLSHRILQTEAPSRSAGD